jgi:hypothetical protein
MIGGIIVLFVVGEIESPVAVHDLSGSTSGG